MLLSHEDFALNTFLTESSMRKKCYM